MSEDSVEKSMGAEQVFRKFVENYDRDWKSFKNTDPGRFAGTVSEWLPALINYYDESQDAVLSMQIMEDTLRQAKGNLPRSKAVLDGLYTASLRVETKSNPSPKFYNNFLESWNREIFEDEKEALTILGTYSPEIIWKYDGSYQSELSMGIVKKKIKTTDDKDKIEALVRGLLIRVLVEIDFPKVRKKLEDMGVNFTED